MKKTIAIAAILLLTLSGCKSVSPAYEREESGGTGFGVTQKSAVTVQDLYFLTQSTTREEVLAALGSPHSYLLSDGNTDTYSLNDGGSLTLKYNDRGLIQSAAYTDSAKETKDLFEFLTEAGVLSGNTAAPKPSGSEEKPESSNNNNNNTQPETKPAENEDTSYFSAKRYSYDMAEKLLEVGASRETVLAAFGKPNSFSSVSFAKDSYLIDVYTMEDGSNLYLDYGYGRSALRAARVIRSGTASGYLGEWGEEEKPASFYRETKNLNLFTSLKRGAKPSEIYRRYGEPDWYEGGAGGYRDAYQLTSGSVLYLTFGTGHNSLTSAVVQKSDGTVTPYGLR